MQKPVSNFPFLFDRIGHFLDQLVELQKKQVKLSSAEFAAEVDKLFKASSPSAADEALDAWTELVDTIYYDRAGRNCPTVNTRMK